MVEPVVVLSLIGALIFLLLIVGAPMKPLKWLGQGAIRLFIGALMIFFLNAFGTMLGYSLPINLFTATVSGFLGVPGLITLVITDMLFISI